MTQQQLSSHPANLIYFAWDILECLLCHPFKKCISYKSQSRNYCLHKYTFLFNLNKLKFVSQAPILPNWQKCNLSHHLGFPKYTLPESHMNKAGFTESLRQRKLEQGETPNLFYSALYWHPHQGARFGHFLRHCQSVLQSTQYANVMGSINLCIFSGERTTNTITLFLL